MVVESASSVPPTEPEPPRYPINIDIERQAKQSRLTNFPLGIGSLIRFVLAIPNLFVLYFLAIAAELVYFVATFAILFTGRYPRGLFNFYVGVSRWGLNLSAYLWHLNDAYPAFSTAEGRYPATFSVEYPERSSRLLNLPLLGIAIKAILAIPNVIVLYLVLLVANLCVFLANFAILFTGSFPVGLHRFVVGGLRWQTRVSAYVAALTDRYPPSA